MSKVLFKQGEISDVDEKLGIVKGYGSVFGNEDSDKIQGTAASIDLTTNNQSVTLFYTGSNKGWQLKTNTA